MKSRFRQWIDRLFPPITPLAPGIYHYQTPAEAPVSYRLHLRIENQGEGILILNASTVLHLNRTATEYAYHLIQQTKPEEIAELIQKRYQINRQQAIQDFSEFSQKIQTLIETPDLDPVTFLDIERQDPHSTEFHAPYRLDCALTYRLPGEYSDGAAPVERVKREMLSTEWETCLKKAWEAGIPHVIFTGGEPTMRPDLVDLIKYSESLGMVSGLLTDGLRLSERDYLHDVLQSGLDHVMITFDPSEEQAWEAIRDVMAEDIYLTVHLTVSDEILPKFPEILAKLNQLQVPSISLSTHSKELHQELLRVRDLVADAGIRLVWDLPVPYSTMNPVSVEIENSEEGKLAHAKLSSLYIEPDGDILISQGQTHVVGNLLLDTWEAIWEQAKTISA